MDPAEFKQCISNQLPLSCIQELLKAMRPPYLIGSVMDEKLNWKHMEYNPSGYKIFF